MLGAGYSKWEQSFEKQLILMAPKKPEREQAQPIEKQ
jgi:hypothetical protein